MNKVELVKMMGLSYVSKSQYQKIVPQHEVFRLVGSRVPIEKVFLGGTITIKITVEDLAPDKLDIKPEDLVEQGDIDYCIKQVVDLIWERAADAYLNRVKRAALLAGGA